MPSGAVNVVCVLVAHSPSHHYSLVHVSSTASCSTLTHIRHWYIQVVIWGSDSLQALNQVSTIAVAVGTQATLALQITNTGATLTKDGTTSQSWNYIANRAPPTAYTMFFQNRLQFGDISGGSLSGNIRAFSIGAATTAPTDPPTDAPGSGNGDPVFTGFHGQVYQVHGYPETWFNIISSPQIDVNAQFAFIDAGTCDYNNTECWTHPGNQTHADTHHAQHVNMSTQQPQQTQPYTIM